jgi:hypothetical protein
MLRRLADENFNADIVRALLLRQPDIDIVRVQDVGLAGVGDRDILAWAATVPRTIKLKGLLVFVAPAATSPFGNRVAVWK